MHINFDTALLVHNLHRQLALLSNSEAFRYVPLYLAATWIGATLGQYSFRYRQLPRLRFYEWRRKRLNSVFLLLGIWLVAVFYIGNGVRAWADVLSR